MAVTSEMMPPTRALLQALSRQQSSAFLVSHSVS